MAMDATWPRAQPGDLRGQPQPQPLQSPQRGAETGRDRDRSGMPSPAVNPVYGNATDSVYGTPTRRQL